MDPEYSARDISSSACIDSEYSDDMDWYDKRSVDHTSPTCTDFEYSARDIRCSTSGASRTGSLSRGTDSEYPVRDVSYYDVDQEWVHSHIVHLLGLRHSVPDINFKIISFMYEISILWCGFMINSLIHRPLAWTLRQMPVVMIWNGNPFIHRPLAWTLNTLYRRPVVI